MSGKTSVELVKGKLMNECSGMGDCSSEEYSFEVTLPISKNNGIRIRLCENHVIDFARKLDECIKSVNVPEDKIKLPKTVIGEGVLNPRP